jgi:hypothetical protein
MAAALLLGACTKNALEDARPDWVREKGPRCRIERRCNGLIGVDCERGHRRAVL